VESAKSKTQIQVVKFILAGLFCSGIEYFTFTLILKTAIVDYLVANVISICVSLCFNYFISKHLIFDKSSSSRKKEILSFVFFSALAILLNQMILWFCVEVIKLDIRLCKVIAIGTVAVFNYLTKKHFVFKG
jgi:putative flippase GtrA